MGLKQPFLNLLASSAIAWGIFGCGGAGYGPLDSGKSPDRTVEDAGCQPGRVWCLEEKILAHCQNDGTIYQERCLGQNQCYETNEGAYCGPFSPDGGDGDGPEDGDGGLDRVFDGGDYTHQGDGDGGPLLGGDDAGLPEVGDGGFDWGGWEINENIICDENNLLPIASFRLKGDLHQKSHYVVFDASDSDDSDYCNQPDNPWGLCENMLNRGIVNYHWDWGDGERENTAHPFGLHQFEEEGNYLVSLIVKDRCDGESEITSLGIEVVQRHDGNSHFGPPSYMYGPEGIHVGGAGNTLEDVFNDINDSSLLDYNLSTKTAVLRHNLIIQPNSRLQIKRETLIIAGQENGRSGIFNEGDLIITNSRLKAERADGSANYVFLNRLGSWLFLEGNVITDLGSDEGSFPLIYGGLNVNNDGSVIKGNQFVVGPRYHNNYAVQLLDTSRVRMIENRIWTDSRVGYGIFLEDNLDGADYNEIKNNEVITEGEGAWGINLQNRMDYNIIQGNRITTRGRDSPGIGSLGQSPRQENTHLLVKGNRVVTEGVNSPGIWLFGANQKCLIRGNEVTTRDGHALWVRYSRDNMIWGNDLTTEGNSNALDVEDGHNNLVLNNLLGARGGRGIMVWLRSSWNLFQGNHFLAGDPLQVHLAGDSSGNLLFLNRFYSRDSVWDEGERNSWNRSHLSGGGNLWMLYDEPSEGCSDHNQDHFCDFPYYLDEGKADYFPQVKE